MEEGEENEVAPVVEEAPVAEPVAPTTDEEVDLLLDEVPDFTAAADFLAKEGQEGFKISKERLDALPDDARALLYNMRVQKDRTVQRLTERLQSLEAQHATHRKETTVAREERLRVAKVYQAAATPAPPEDAEPDADRDPRGWLKWVARTEARIETAKYGASLGAQAKAEEEAIAKEASDYEANQRADAALGWFKEQGESGVTPDVLELVANAFVEEFKGSIPLDDVLDLVLVRKQRETGERQEPAVRRVASLRPSGNRAALPAPRYPPPPVNGTTDENREYFRRYPQAAKDVLKRGWT
jgi:hypothetical protein